MVDVVVPPPSSSRRRYYGVRLYITGLLAVAALSYFTGLKNGLNGHSVLQTEDDAALDTQSSLQLLEDPKSTDLRSEFGKFQQSPGLVSSSSSFSFTMFPTVDEMFVNQRLIEMSAQHPKDLVVIFVDTTYLETFGVWLDHYKHHDNSGRILSIFAISEIAYDKVSAAFSSPTTQAKLRGVGETLLVNLNPGKGEDMRNADLDHFLNNLWVLRLHIMQRIINTFLNLNVLYTDADAIWLKDPVQLYNHPQHQSSNIVASRGTYPDYCPLAKELHDDEKMHLNTVTICFGFTFFRNSPDLHQLAQNLQNAVARYRNDDQIAINCVLNLQYGSNDELHMNDPSSIAAFTQPDKSVIRSFFGKVIAHNIKVSILPYEQVTRRCGRDEGMLENSVVAHCYTEKEGKSKLNAFDHFGFLIEGQNSLRHVFDHPELDTPILASSSAPDTRASWEEAAYSLSLDRFWRHIKAATPEGVSIENSYYPDLKAQHLSTKELRSTRLLNSVRIPKSGSSALSVTARALSGCHPDGYPCCKFPGDPVGSCPRKDLMCSLVTGCTDHRPDYDGDEAVITTLRDPVSRSVSAFFYHYPHTSVKHGESHTWEKFVENIQSPRYRNILTKMLNGAYSYVDFDEVKHTVPRAKARLCSIAWFGLSEMPVSSSMMLYETPQFRKLLPNPVAFGLQASDATAAEHAAEEKDGLRVNSDSEYKEFLATSFATNDGSSFVMQHNQHDIEVFQFAEKLFCGRLLAKIGLVEEMKQVGLGLEEIEKCASIGFDNIEELCYNIQNNA